ENFGGKKILWIAVDAFAGIRLGVPSQRLVWEKGQKRFFREFSGCSRILGEGFLRDGCDVRRFCSV
uniref:hypothetical protein n=1 Tax=Stieleria mannarensis TaxID=2755585 RepID=UPI001C718481